MYDPNDVPTKLLITKTQGHALFRLLMESMNRHRWIKAELYPGPFKRPERSFDEWYKEVDTLLEAICQEGQA